MPEPLYSTLKKGTEKSPPELTRGSTFKHVLRLGLPSMFAMGLQASYDIVDLIYIGRLKRGADAMAAVTIYGFLLALIIVFNQIADVGATALISRYCGARRFNAAKLVTGQAWALKLMLSLPMAILGIIFASNIFSAYGAPAGVVELGTQYSVIMFTGLPFVFCGLTLNNAFRAAGDVRTPIIMASISIGVNLVLDPILIFGPGPFPALGISGAAIASVFSQALLVIIGLRYLVAKKSPIRVRIIQLFSPSLRWGFKIFRIGAPAALGDLLRTIIALFTGWVVLRYGKETMAAFGVGSRLLFSVFIPIFAIGTAISALVGHNLGARKPARAIRAVINGTFFSLTIALLFGLIGFLFPASIMRVFTPDPVVIIIGIPLMRIGSFAIIGVAVATANASAFWGAGDTLPPMVVWIIATVGIQLPILLFSIFYFQTGPTFIWMSVTAGAITAMMISSIWLAKGNWLKKKI